MVDGFPIPNILDKTGKTDGKRVK